jgi:hypothetical protein
MSYGYGPDPYAGGMPPGIAAGPPRPVRVRPGRVWYVAGVVLLIGGLAWLVVGFAMLNSQISSFPRAFLPAGGVVDLSHAGSYIVYYEAPGASSGQVPNFNVQIAPDSAGAVLRSLAPYSGARLKYDFFSHQGRAVLSLVVSSPGMFKVSAPSAPGGSDLAFGDSILSGLLVIVLPTVAAVLVGIIGCAVIFAVRRGRIAASRRPMPPGPPFYG